MPVSSMSTEMAMCGGFAGFEKSSIRLCAYVSLEVDDARERALVVRVVRVEPLRR